MVDLGNISLNFIAGIPWYILIPVLAWLLTWKGVALWKAARKSHLVWFIVLLIANTFGILEILYIFLFSELKLEEKKRKKKRR